MYEKIKERYEKRYIRDDQLARYVTLGVITQAQADEIMGDEGQNHTLVQSGPLDG